MTPRVRESRLMYRLKMVGAKTEPCGSFCFHTVAPCVDIVACVNSNCVLLQRYEELQL